MFEPVASGTLRGGACRRAAQIVSRGAEVRVRSLQFRRDLVIKYSVIVVAFQRKAA